MINQPRDISENPAQTSGSFARNGRPPTAQFNALSPVNNKYKVNCMSKPNLKKSTYFGNMDNSHTSNQGNETITPMKLLNSQDKGEPQNMSQRWRNNVHSGSRAKIVPQNDDHEERDSTPVMVNNENPRGSYRENKKRLKNSFFITNALNNETPNTPQNVGSPD